MSLDNADIERMKEIFVTRRECENTTEALEGKLSSDSVRLAVIESRLSTITWLLTAIGSGVIATLIKLFLGGG